MGQQQLLLLALSAIIVAMAIVVGIGLFNGSAIKANGDAVRQDILNIAGRLEQYYRTPTELGGGNHSFPSTLSFPDIGLYYNQDGSNAGSTYSNLYGTYVLSVDGSSVTISGTGNEAGVAHAFALRVDPETKQFVLTEIAAN